MAKPNYYEILGVSRTATETEIKQAYRKLAREYHPDVNDSPNAEATFKDINAAYGTLSDSLKRADYDQSLADTGVRRDTASSYANETTADYGPSPSPAPDYTNPYRRAMLRAAYARVAAAAMVAGLVGLLTRLGLHALTDQAITTWTVISGIAPAAALGGLYASDMNFKVETFLDTGWLGRSYTFARTVVMSLALAFYLGLAGAAIDREVGGDIHLAGPILALVGVLVGAVVGSDGDTPEKLRSGTGRFNLFYTFLRGGQIGALGALIGAALGGILAVSGISNVWSWSVYIGFALGMIVGSIKPPNLAAYASYASASVKNVLFLLIVMTALLAGMGFGIVFQPALSNYFKIG